MSDFNNYNDIEKNKGKAVFCYLTVLWLIPFLMWRDSRFVKFHINQGFNLLICEICLVVVDRLLGFLLGPGLLLGIWGFVYSIGSLILMVFVVLGIINAINGQTKKLPIIGDWNFLNLDSDN